MGGDYAGNKYTVCTIIRHNVFFRINSVVKQMANTTYF